MSKSGREERLPRCKVSSEGSLRWEVGTLECQVMQQVNEAMSNPRGRTPKVTLWEEPLREIANHGESVRKTILGLGVFKARTAEGASEFSTASGSETPGLTAFNK